MRLPRRSLAGLAGLAVLAACGRDPVAPHAAALAPASAPAFLLAPGEWSRTLVDSTDAQGTHVFVTEYAAGVYADPTRAPAASVTIRTVIPATAGGPKSKACITSTIDHLDTQLGWAATVKKPGGCDKEIGVALANAATGERAEFSFLYVAGKTRIDAGAVR